jgi:dTDP-4-dehydrorhamnose 3,5-epimerase-like enzyme
VFWIYDVPSGEVRGGHAYRQSEEFIIALSGSFDVLTDDGRNVTKYQLNRSNSGLYIPSGAWRHLENFSTNAVALLVASTEFDERDYIRNKKSLAPYFVSPKTGATNPEAKSPGEAAVDFLNSSIADCRELDLPINHRVKGNITVIEKMNTVPFKVERVYYLYDIPGGQERGGHAHKELWQLVVAASGSFDILVDDGKRKKVVTLNRANRALLVVPGIWRELRNFSGGSICLVLSSHKYSEADYYRDYQAFIAQKHT